MYYPGNRRKISQLGGVDSRKTSQQRLYYLTKPKFVKLTLNPFVKPKVGLL